MRLLHDLIVAAIEMGADAVSLEVRVTNWGAQRLYGRFGFHPVGVRKNYYQEIGEDALIMWLDGVQEAGFRDAARRPDGRAPRGHPPGGRVRAAGRAGGEPGVTACRIDVKVLGIETSCDETGVAVVEDGRVLSNLIASQVDLHERFGGVVPELASRAHVEALTPLLDEALRDRGVRLRRPGRGLGHGRPGADRGAARRGGRGEGDRARRRGRRSSA